LEEHFDMTLFLPNDVPKNEKCLFMSLIFSSLPPFAKIIALPKMKNKQATIAFLLLSNLVAVTADGAWRCGSAYGDRTCAQSGYLGNNYCCSAAGYCGTSDDYCGEGCQNGPCGTTPPNHNYCGSNWGQALQCGKSCYGGTEGEYQAGETCYANVDSCPVVAPPEAGNRNYCGSKWETASCAHSCYGGTDEECPAGLTCWGDITRCPVVSPPTVTLSSVALTLKRKYCLITTQLLMNNMS
jgi:hypothetical protein